MNLAAFRFINEVMSFAIEITDSGFYMSTLCRKQKFVANHTDCRKSRNSVLYKKNRIVHSIYNQIKSTVNENHKKI